MSTFAAEGSLAVASCRDGASGDIADTCTVLDLPDCTSVDVFQVGAEKHLEGAGMLRRAGLLLYEFNIFSTRKPLVKG